MDTHYKGNLDTSPLSVQDWMVTILVLGIPIVNVVAYLYWASSKTGNVNRQNFCIASIYWFLIVLVLYILL